MTDLAYFKENRDAFVRQWNRLTSESTENLAESFREGAEYRRQVRPAAIFSMQEETNWRLGHIPRLLGAFAGATYALRAYNSEKAARALWAMGGAVEALTHKIDPTIVNVSEADLAVLESCRELAKMMEHIDLAWVEKAVTGARTETHELAHR